MKLWIVWSRSLNIDLEKDILENFNIWEIDLIISWWAVWIDTQAENFAKKYWIETLIIKPNWDLWKKAWYLRNIEICENSDEVIAFWDWISKGTQHSFRICKGFWKNIKIILKKD